MTALSTPVPTDPAAHAGAAPVGTDDRATALSVRDVYKVFGRRPVEAIRRLEQGASRDDVKPLGTAERAVFDEVTGRVNAWEQIGQNLYSGIRHFQENLANGKPNDWYCRAGARYLYICENGLVHWCSQQRGVPGVPLEGYTIEDIRREFMNPKWCAPYCTIGCVHRVSFMDFWRYPQAHEPRVPNGSVEPAC